jgi:hypothetical protein
VGWVSSFSAMWSKDECTCELCHARRGCKWTKLTEASGVAKMVQRGDVGIEMVKPVCGDDESVSKRDRSDAQS